MTHRTINDSQSRKPSIAILLLNNLLGLQGPILTPTDPTTTDPDISESAASSGAFLKMTRRERRKSALLTMLSLPLTALLGPRYLAADISLHRTTSQFSRDLDALVLQQHDVLEKVCGLSQAADNDSAIVGEPS